MEESRYAGGVNDQTIIILFDRINTSMLCFACLIDIILFDRTNASMPCIACTERDRCSGFRFAQRLGVDSLLYFLQSISKTCRDLPSRLADPLYFFLQ